MLIFILHKLALSAYIIVVIGGIITVCTRISADKVSKNTTAERVEESYYYSLKFSNYAHLIVQPPALRLMI